MGTHHPIRKTVAPEPTVIPDKLYFRIGDVAKLCDVQAYVLRFWETEFPQLKPNKGGTGQRLYRKRDVEMALRIKSLLYDQGYTIPGARTVLKSDSKDKDSVASFPAPEPVEAPAPIAAVPQTSSTGVSTARLTALRDDMRSLLATLSQPVSTEPALEVTPKPMRPRLVLEPKPEPVKTITMKPKLQLQQRDLFGGFDPDDTPQAG